MRAKTYLVLCVLVTLIWVPALLLIPSFAQAVESVMLWFLSTNAR